MQGRKHIVVVDDEPGIRETIQEYLELHDFRVTAAGGGEELRRAVESHDVDLVLLDIRMPGEDGLSLARFLRAEKQVGIIMLTAAGEVVDRIVGLEMGADDYLAKPVDLRELLARIKAVLRRANGAPPGDSEERGKVLRFAGWTLDLGRRRLESADGVPIELSTGEYELLVALAERPQRVLNRDQLLDLARGRAAIPFDRSIDVQVSRLRRKIESDPKSPQIITTVRGGGYMFTPAVERA